MTSLADALDTAKPPQIESTPAAVPKGWERSVEWDGTAGTVTTGPIESDVDPAVWRELIADWGLDPDNTEVVDGTVKLKGWDSPVKGTTTGETIRLRSYSVAIRQRRSQADTADVDALCKAALKRRPPKVQPVAVDETERALVVCAADWQLGKGEADGSAGTVDRIVVAADRVIRRLRELKRLGRPVDVVYVVGLGDLIEGCSEFYASQTFTVDLNRRDQVKVVRRLILQLVDRLVDYGVRVVLTGVPGNHGENRKDGKAFTDFLDNDDLAVIEQVGEIMGAHPARYGDVATFLPDDLSMTLDVCGVRVGFAHGHQIRGGGHAAKRVEEWWSKQIVGNQPTATAQILVTGHLHHFVCSEALGRTVLQCPAMDPGSFWYTATSGQSSPAGMLTFAVGGAYGARGFGDLQIL